MSRIVIALGGNALGKTPSEQKELVLETAKSIVDIVKDRTEVVIAHGNGPQVGIINLAFDYASSKGSGVPIWNFCGLQALHALYGYQNSLRNGIKL